MRFNPFSQKLTALEIVNSWQEKEILRILRDYGQERFARRIAKALIEARKKEVIETTGRLVEVIKQALPKRYQQGRIHPATLTFQALRITVNQELENLQKVLPQALEVLEKGGRLVAICFHSLEDRVIKNFFRDNKKQLRIITKKPVIPSSEEIFTNPRSRSAKLRAGEKI